MISNSIINHREHDFLKVLDFTDQQLGSRLMAMGLLPGSEITIEKVAPLKGGYCLNIGGKKIAIRYKEAASIIVE